MNLGGIIEIDCHGMSSSEVVSAVEKKVNSAPTDFINFCYNCNSTAISNGATKSVEEREKDLIARGRGSIITEALRDMWRDEIKKYESIRQEEVTIP